MERFVLLPIGHNTSVDLLILQVHVDLLILQVHVDLLILQVAI